MDDRNDEQFEEEIAELLAAEYAQAQLAARVPPAQIIWLRAELQARQDAARRVIRPIVVGQAVGIAALAGLLVALLSRVSLSQLPEIPVPVVEAVLGSWLLLAPIALYLALSRDN
jgi:hypothetical protein